MKIDGRLIASEIFEDLTKQMHDLRLKNIIPHLVIILIGNDPASESYVRQKVKKGEAIGAKVTLIRFPETVKESVVIKAMQQCNNDSTIHGIIVQRPIPSHIDGEKLNLQTMVSKDIDAFRNDSPYTMPLAAAVMKILENVFARLNLDQGLTLTEWLTTKNIVVLGKGETGGGPVITLLKKMNVQVTVIDSKTENPQELLHNADIIISAVGKKDTVNSSKVKNGAILVGIGMHTGKDGKLHGDYDESNLMGKNVFYTPIPGGVGPVNVAMLLKNLVEAAKR